MRQAIPPAAVEKKGDPEKTLRLVSPMIQTFASKPK
jgi:hypothetical protein